MSPHHRLVLPRAVWPQGTVMYGNMPRPLDPKPVLLHNSIRIGIPVIHD